MKRDMDLVRAILFEVEAMDSPGNLSELKLDEWDEETVAGHVRLLRGAGFLEAIATGGLPPDMHIAGLSWDGHDFLDSIRDEGVWTAVKAKLGKVGGSAGVELIKALALQIGKDLLGLDR